MEFEGFVDNLLSSKARIYYKLLDHNPPTYKMPEEPLIPEIKRMLKSMGIERLFSHQAAAIDAINKGKNLLCSTPTSSGKSLVYNIPVFTSIIKDKDSKSLYIFPLKALGQDQLKAIREFGINIKQTSFSQGHESIIAEIYDGDTPSYKRLKIRDRLPSIIITNPDMLHLAILPYHKKWQGFFKMLKFVVIDELHTYRGVFGSHFTHILSRLRRICRYYGSNPQFIALSATMANPEDFIESLLGCDFEVIKESGAPSNRRHFLIVNPEDNPYLESTRLFIDCLQAGFKTIVFTKARKTAELIYLLTLQHEPSLYGKISPYRAGYLACQRREIEYSLLKGELLGVISTSALELGVDIGGLDACILIGYPGSIISTWQRAGRVGRREKEAVIIMVTLSDALDQYFASNPEDLFSRKYEDIIIDPKNPKIFKEHLLSSCAEIPLRGDEVSKKDILEDLEKEGLLYRMADEDIWFSRRRYPQAGINIRSIGKVFLLINKEGDVIGTIDENRVLRDCHKGAIYLHKAEQYEVVDLDLEDKKVYLLESDLRYYTQPNSFKEVEILREFRRKVLYGFVISLGEIRVTERVVSFERKDIYTRNTISTHQLDLPPQIFETIGLWIKIDSCIKGMNSLDLLGGLHGIEHTIINLFPLFVMCDQDDVGGISNVVHPQVKSSVIFIYDGYPGGIGLTEAGYNVIDKILLRVRELIKGCGCDKGCPSCIQSPRCGSNNRPLDKKASIFILDSILDQDLEEETYDQLQKTIHPTSDTRDQRLIFFDLETQLTADEVGGWDNKHLMRLALAVTYDLKDRRFRFYEEDDVYSLIEELKSADLVIGFNIKRFDFEVLNGYTDFDFARLSTIDILEDIYKRLGLRLSLSHIVKVTLGEDKLADGLTSIRWFKEGRMEKIREYCKHDVELIYRLYEYGKTHGFLLYQDRNGLLFRVRVEW